MVSGAGDTVIAILTAAIAAKRSSVEAAILANCAAGVVVDKVERRRPTFNSCHVSGRLYHTLEKALTHVRRSTLDSCEGETLAKCICRQSIQDLNFYSFYACSKQFLARHSESLLSMAKPNGSCHIDHVSLQVSRAPAYREGKNEVRQGNTDEQGRQLV